MSKIETGDIYLGNECCYLNGSYHEMTYRFKCSEGRIIDIHYSNEDNGLESCEEECGMRRFDNYRIINSFNVPKIVVELVDKILADIEWTLDHLIFNELITREIRAEIGDFTVTDIPKCVIGSVKRIKKNYVDEFFAVNDKSIVHVYYTSSTTGPYYKLIAISAILEDQRVFSVRADKIRTNGKIPWHVATIVASAIEDVKKATEVAKAIKSAKMKQSNVGNSRYYLVAARGDSLKDAIRATIGVDNCVTLKLTKMSHKDVKVLGEYLHGPANYTIASADAVPMSN